MSTIVTIQSSDQIANSRADINTNFSNLNTDKQEKGSGVTGNIVKFGASNVLADTGKTAPTGAIVGDTDSQTLTNKTLTTPTIGSFANAGHNHTNSAGGGQITDAALSASVGVAKGGTGVATLAAHGVVVGNGASAVNVTGAGSSGQVLTSNGASSDPTFQAAAGATAKAGGFTKDISTTTTDVVAHGLGKTPKLVRVSLIGYSGTNAQLIQSFGAYDGSTNNCIYLRTSGTLGGNNSIVPSNSTTYTVIAETGSGANDNAAVTVDGTNITFTWTKNGSPTGTAYIMWEVIG